MFSLARTRGAGAPDDLLPSTRSAWWRPAAPVAAYVVAFLLVAPTRPPLLAGLPVVDAVLVLLIGFGINAVLEEFFYRRWLLDRWREILGPWPAIALSSVVFALWHVAIQGTGEPIRDVANALAYQGVSGVFLGFLWVRFRMMWPLLVIHGIWNANPLNLF
nr:CPBP family intramembrane glutamic endopeptidase [Gordonia araii]